MADSLRKVNRLHQSVLRAVAAGMLWRVAGAMIVVASARAEDAATIQLQQDVLELKRINQQIERRIESLERQFAGQGGLAGGALSARGATGNPLASSLDSLPWMNTVNWDRLKPGTPELEVIRVLGVPNSLRDAEGGRQIIYYALEIGTARFLSGSVTLSDHRVVEVQKPTLK